MHISSGNWRVVVVFDHLPFVLKFPRMYLKNTLRHLFECIRHRRWKSILRHAQYDWKILHGYQSYLLAGLILNWREFWFWQTRRHPFTVPTYISLCGLCNLQKKVPVADIDMYIFFREVFRIAGKAAQTDMHHFSEAANFTIEGGLRMLDYGDEKSQALVLNKGYHLHRDFDVERILREHNAASLE